MTADVVDYDELSSGQRHESGFTATFSWVMKVGMMISMLMRYYPLDTERMAGIRRELEARRGAV